VLSGSGTLIFDEMQQPLENASINLIGPNLFHSVNPDESNPVLRSTLRFTFRDDSGNDPWFPGTEAEQLKAVLSDVTNRKLPANTDHGHLFQLQVNRLLQRHFGTSFKQKLLDTRLEVAKDLLRTTDLPVEQIAGESAMPRPTASIPCSRKSWG
jgi:AraC-like DNA-binding protein